MLYALDPSVLQELWREQRSASAPSAKERFDYIQSHADASSLRVSGGVAEIDVFGILTRSPDLLISVFYGNTSYESLIRDLDTAANDRSVRSVQLNVDSPGGAVDGLFETMDAVAAFPKPIVARASKALSGAFGLASATNRIEAVHESSQFGSVGVAAALFADNRVIHVASSAAPRKRPDPRTDEGQAVIRAHLDDVHALFAAAIARGRGTSVSTVNATYGRGGIVLANDAKAKGMIDSIASSPTKKSKSATAQRTTMKFSLSDLKSTNPSLHQQFTEICGENAEALFREIASDGYAEGYNEVLMAERARCIQHVDAAERAGDPMLALDAVNDRTPYDEQAMQGYMQAALNRPRPNFRGELPAASVDMGDIVVAEMLRKRGRTAEADAIAPAMPLATAPRKMTDDELQAEIVALMAQKGRGR